MGSSIFLPHSVGHTRYTERGGESVCTTFITFSILTINNLLNIMHYHIIIISSSTLLSSSHKKHNMIHSTPYFTCKPKSWGENHGSLIIVVFQQQLEEDNNPLITMTSILQLQLEGDYNPLIYMLQPEGSSNSLVLRIQPEGGYNPLSFPHPTTLI